MDQYDPHVAELLERAIAVFERLAADVHLMRTEFRGVSDRLAALDASVDALMLTAARKAGAQ